MANVRNSNTFYIDTQYTGSADELVASNLSVVGIIMRATGANAQVVLVDAQAAQPVKLSLGIATAGETIQLRLAEAPVLFPNGIRPLTLVNAVVTVILKESRG